MAYSCRTNVFKEFRRLMKKKYTQLRTKQLKQKIFKSMGIYGFSQTDIRFNKSNYQTFWAIP